MTILTTESAKRRFVIMCVCTVSWRHWQSAKSHLLLFYPILVYTPISIWKTSSSRNHFVLRFQLFHFFVLLIGKETFHGFKGSIWQRRSVLLFASLFFTFRISETGVLSVSQMVMLMLFSLRLPFQESWSGYRTVSWALTGLKASLR